MIFGLEESIYEVRLKMLKHTTLEERRQRADMIEVFKIVNSMEGLKINHFFDLRDISSTRRHSLKVFKKRFRLDWGKYMLVIGWLMRGTSFLKRSLVAKA